MADEPRRPSLGSPVLLGSVILLVLVIVAAVVPLWTCPECKALNATRPVFVVWPECKGCGGKGRVNLYRHWTIVQDYREKGLKLPYQPW